VLLTPAKNLLAVLLTPVNSFLAVPLTLVINFRFFGYLWTVSTTPGKNVITGVVITGNTVIVHRCRRYQQKIYHRCRWLSSACKIVHRVAVRGAGRPDLFLTHLCEVLLEPILRPLAVVGRVTLHAGRCNGDFQLSSPSSDTIFPKLTWKCSCLAKGTSLTCVGVTSDDGWAPPESLVFML
jgi:hypothetical protein